MSPTLKTHLMNNAVALAAYIISLVIGSRFFPVIDRGAIPAIYYAWFVWLLIRDVVIGMLLRPVGRLPFLSGVSVSLFMLCALGMSMLRGGGLMLDELNLAGMRLAGLILYPILYLMRFDVSLLSGTLQLVAFLIWLFAFFAIPSFLMCIGMMLKKRFIGQREPAVEDL